MGEKMPETTKAVMVNAAILAALIRCYFAEGYGLNIVLISGVMLLAVANVAMYLKRRKVHKAEPLRPN
jgi:hypothetical protein